MKDFKIIYETNMGWGDYLICNHCGQRVERGIASVSHHWLSCLKNKQGLIHVPDKAIQKLLDTISINA